MIIKKDPSLIQSYLEDSSNLRGGYTSEVRVPESVDEVSRLLKDADDKKIPVTISGGGTGTSGGRVPFGGIVLSMEGLNKILKIEKKPSGGAITCEAGLLIDDLKKKALEKNLFYAYDPTEQTSLVGGNIATNASGARSFKYGSTRQSVLALRLALADGTVFSVERGAVKAKNGKLSFKTGKKDFVVPVPDYRMPETKSSAGYYSKKDMDLIDLFIGQEGTLGCILGATLKLADRPEDILSIFAFFSDEEKACDFAVEARDMSREATKRTDNPIDALSIEYFDKNSVNLLKDKYGNIPEVAGACVFFEQEISRAREDMVLNAWEALLAKYGVSSGDTWIAMNEKERQGLLDKRHSMGESMNELVRQSGHPKVSTDLAVPDPRFMEMALFYKEILKDIKIRHYLFGHIGDSHLHLTLIPRSEEEFNAAKGMALRLVKKSVSLGGTVSAEHGIGKLRREYLKIMYGEKGISEMIRVKKALDPNMVLGRGNIFSLPAGQAGVMF